MAGALRQTGAAPGALKSLARHYGLAPGRPGSGPRGIRHWGAEGYRPEVT